MKKWNTTLRYAGFSLIGVALLMFISAFIAFRNGMDDSFNPLVFSGMVSLLSGFFAIITTKPQEKMTVEDGFRIVTGCWVAACVFGALPFLLFGGEFTVVNAFFESVSGFTTTGASIPSTTSRPCPTVCSFGALPQLGWAASVLLPWFHWSFPDNTTVTPYYPVLNCRTLPNLTMAGARGTSSIG